MRRLVVLLVIAALTLLAGCGDDGETASSDPSDATETIGAGSDTDGTDLTDESVDTDDTDDTDDTEATDATDATDGTTGTTDDEDYIDAVMTAGGDMDEMIDALGEDATRCFVSVVVHAFGADTLQAAGIDPDSYAREGLENKDIELPDSQVPALRDDLAECFDPVEFWVTFVGITVSELSEPPLTEDQKDCIRDAIDDTLALDALVEVAIENGDLDENSAIGEVFRLTQPCGPSDASS